MPKFSTGHVPWNKERTDYLTPELRKKMGASNLGLASPKKGLPAPKTDGEKNGLWKGERVGYSGLHKWVARKLGKAKECAYCGESPKVLDYANIDHLYKRVLEDYFPLCRRCHRAYDYGRFSKAY